MLVGCVGNIGYLLIWFCLVCNIGHIAGALSLSSLSSSRVFFDMDVQATREYLAWYVFIYWFGTSISIHQAFYFLKKFVSEHFLRFESNTEVSNKVNAEIVTKAEKATIGELLSYMKQEGAKVQ